MKKTGVVVAGTAMLLLATAPLAFADAQGQRDQHNDQYCGHDSDVTSFEDVLLFSIAQDHRNDNTCTQDNGSEGDEHHNKKHDKKHD